MSLINLQSILGKSLERKGMARSITAAMVCEAFDGFAVERFGEELGKQVNAQTFAKDTIMVKSTSSVLSQEIKLHEGEIKDIINEKLGEGVVKRLRFMV